jgi:phosphoserine aminotransferase
MAMWSLLGERGVDVISFEAFSSDWATDLEKQLKIQDLKIHKADYGKLPDLSKVDCDRDVVFTWNGTTSGVKIPNGDWIKDGRKGLTLCDATSAVFAMELPWKKLDVVTYSWQKAMGGEAAHGVLILSPRAVERLESYKPNWPLPKIFRMTKGGKINEGIFKGETINTPSMLCVEDAIDGLKWAESIGGLKTLVKRSEDNLKILSDWAAKTPWIEFLAEDPKTVSSTSVCFKIADPWYAGLSKDEQAAKAKDFAGLLEKEGVAYDIGSYRDAPPGIRIWAGSTVETSDIRALLPWLEWAFGAIKENRAAA